MSLRVGIDGRAFVSPAAGVRRYVRELCDAMHASGAPVTYVALGAPEGLALPAGVMPGREPGSLPTNLGRHLTGLPRAIASHAVDLFHAPAYVAPLWGATPTVLSIHDVSYARHPEWYPYRRDPLRRAFYRASARRASAIITISTFSRDEIAAAYGISESRIHVTPLGVSPFFTPASSDDSGDARAVAAALGLARESGGAPGVPGPVASAPFVPTPFALHVGDLHPRRNVDLALRAVLKVRQLQPAWRDLCLVLAGVDRGVAGALVDEAAAAGASSALVCLGSVTDETLRALYRGAAAFVYPSRYEGFGLPLVEAMACGTPVVAARAAATPELTGDAALLFEPGDERGCTDALAALLADPARAAAARTSGLARAAIFSWTRTARLTYDVYRALNQLRFGAIDTL